MVTKQECMVQLDLIEKLLLTVRKQCEGAATGLTELDREIGGLRYMMADSDLPKTSGRRRTCNCGDCPTCNKRARQARWIAKRKSLHVDSPAL